MLALVFEVHALVPEVVVFLFLSEAMGMGIGMELLAETSARTGMAALGAGLGMERYESTKMSFWAPSRKL